MTALAQISINFLALNTPHNALYRKPNFIGLKLRRPICCYTHLSTRNVSFWNKLRAFKEKSSFLKVKRAKNGSLERWGGEKRMIVVNFKQGLGFDGIGDGGGGGGGGGRDNILAVCKVLQPKGLVYYSFFHSAVNLCIAALHVLTMIILSINSSHPFPGFQLLAVLLPIVGLGAFIWWAGRDIVQGTCPNCGNDFQIFRSTLNDEVQLCPFCTQPFSVVGDEFVRDPVKFSNQSTTFGQAFSDFSARSKKGKDSTIGIVDVEAEVKDAE
uniref:Uncharacterized protein n=1 Tax=Nicotiana tabacum TaxID=4097 RepID=A0A1S3YED7_TOBAC|nr:PREDICTED: uncharacterized protein LOC107775183 [Nicotiana tabacum]